jgi:hypothetical protein
MVVYLPMLSRPEKKNASSLSGVGGVRVGGRSGVSPAVQGWNYITHWRSAEGIEKVRQPTATGPHHRARSSPSPAVPPDQDTSSGIIVL